MQSRFRVVAFTLVAWEKVALLTGPRWDKAVQSDGDGEDCFPASPSSLPPRTDVVECSSSPSCELTQEWGWGGKNRAEKKTNYGVHQKKGTLDFLVSFLAKACDLQMPYTVLKLCKFVIYRWKVFQNPSNVSDVMPVLMLNEQRVYHYSTNSFNAYLSEIWKISPKTANCARSFRFAERFLWNGINFQHSMDFGKLYIVGSQIYSFKTIWGLQSHTSVRSYKTKSNVPLFWCTLYIELSQPPWLGGEDRRSKLHVQKRKLFQFEKIHMKFFWDFFSSFEDYFFFSIEKIVSLSVLCMMLLKGVHNSEEEGSYSEFRFLCSDPFFGQQSKTEYDGGLWLSTYVSPGDQRRKEKDHYDDEPFSVFRLQDDLEWKLALPWLGYVRRGGKLESDLKPSNELSISIFGLYF